MKHARLLATLVVTVALVESALGLVQPKRVATDADWVAATDHVRGEMQPDDLVVFAPDWIDPVGRQHLGDRMPVAMVARADADRYARIWELSVHGAHADETRGLVPIEERAFGNVALRLFRKSAVKVIYDFTDQFAAARVTTRPSASANADESPCTTDGKARRCSSSRVEPRVLEIDYRPRRGILVPALAGHTIIASYTDVPAGTLVGYVGLHDYYARKSSDGVVRLRVVVDAHKSITLPVRNPRRDGEGWQRFELPLGEGVHEVRFEVEADGDPKFRLPGFHAEVRAP